MTPILWGITLLLKNRTRNHPKNVLSTAGQPAVRPSTGDQDPTGVATGASTGIAISTAIVHGAVAANEATAEVSTTGITEEEISTVMNNRRKQV